MNSRSKSGIIAIVIAVIALCLSVVSLLRGQGQRQEQQTEQTPRDVQYVMYLGTNDKDSNTPVFPPEEAKLRAEDILIRHFGGDTIQEAEGGWKDGDITYQEYTLVIYLSDTNLEAVHAASDDLIDAFHQSSVLIQANETTTEFYAGSNS